MNKIHVDFKDEAEFIWELLYLCFVLEESVEALKLVSKMYEYKFSVSPDKESFLLNFMENGKCNELTELAINVLDDQIYDIENHVILIASLVKNDYIDLNKASLLMKINISDDNSHLSDAVKDVVDAAWLTNQDSKDGFMEADDDDLLSNALKNVLIKQ